MKKNKTKTQTKIQQIPLDQSSKKQNSSDSSASSLTFLDHLHELRSRLFWSVGTLIAASAIGFQFKDTLIDVIMAPLRGEQLVYLTPGGGFSFIFTLCIYFGLLISVPVIVYHAYRFLQPLMRDASRKFVATFMVLSSILAATGALFGYFVAIPAAINFLTTFAGEAVTPNLTADSYLGFVVAYMLGLAALFQIPLFLFLFDHVKPIPPGGLSSSQRFVIIGAAVAAAVITPTPDAANMAIIAIPVIAVYEFGALAVYTRRRLFRHEVARAKVPQVLKYVQEEAVVPVSRLASKPVPAPLVTVQPSSVAVAPQFKRLDGFAPNRKSRPAAQMSQHIIISPMHEHRKFNRSKMSSGVRPLRSLDGFSTI